MNDDLPPPRINYEPYKITEDELQRRIDAANESYNLRIKIIDNYLKFTFVAIFVSVVIVPIVIALAAYLGS